jgi:predicted Fe-Mo cluster-binding NifX family protein
MKIAISANGPNLEAEVDPRFGRCQYFVIADPETMAFEAIENANAMSGGGAGISAGQMIAEKGVEAVLTGNCGPNAYQVLSAAGIKVITGASGKVKDVIEGYQAGTFEPSGQANVTSHFGTGANPGMVASLGMGRGIGIGHGVGRGMGRCRGMRVGITPPTGMPNQPQSPEQELAMLKAQSQALAGQLSEMKRRIEELEKNRK